MAAAGARRRRDDRARRRAARARGSRPASSTGSPTSTSARTAASRPRRATAAFRRRSASRRTTWSCTGSRARTRSRDGDLITIDVGVTLDGYIADSAFTFAVGEISDEAQRLLDAGREALAAGIAQARPGNRVGDISAAVQQHVEGAGFSVVRSLVGHGVGRSYHEDPHIPNFGQPGRGPLLSRGDDARDRADDHGGPPGGLRARRRVVDLDRGRLARGPLRAHRRDHGRRAADPDGCGDPSAT